MYVKLTNGNVDTYPYNVGQLRRDNPNTSFPKRIPDEMLSEWGVYPVNYKAQPDYDVRTQRVEKDAQPVLEGGKWLIGWTVVNKTTEEMQDDDANASRNVRTKRDTLLSKTDWVVVMHTEKGTNIPLEWETYRQALRDITSHVNFPYLEEADWPVKP